MSKDEIEIEICIAIETKEYYFKTRDQSPFSDLMFQYWCGVEIGLCLALGKLKPTMGEYYFGMPYSEYAHRCKCYFYYGLDGKSDKM